MRANFNWGGWIRTSGLLINSQVRARARSVFPSEIARQTGPMPARSGAAATRFATRRPSLLSRFQEQAP